MEEGSAIPQPSVRGLKDSSFGTPLTHFKGKFHSYQTALSKFQDKQGKSKVNVILNFSDISVIASKEPYNFPTAQIEIPYSEYNKSRWGFWGNSLAKFLSEGEDVAQAVGRNLEMKVTPGHDMGQKDKETNQKILSECWEVIGIEGAGVKIDPMTRLMELIEGKSTQEFNQLALADTSIRADQTLVAGLINNTLLSSLEAKNQIKKDDKGIWHKV